MHWILSNTITDDKITLHPQFFWRDELDWTSLVQSEPVYTLTGAMDIQQGTKKAGRPITLDGTDARLSRHDIKTLQAWASMPELKMRLIHPTGQVFDVIFNRPFISDIKGKQYRPIDQSDDDWASATLHFLTV